MQDRMILKNMVFYGYHGVFSAEQELGQRIEVDLELISNLRDVARHDDLEAGINYVDVYTVVKEIVEEQEFNLMEALAQAIVNGVFGAFPAEEIRIRVRKPYPPVGGVMDAFEVELHRQAPGRE
jgi:dihydroneopterin aldolase